MLPSPSPITSRSGEGLLGQVRLAGRIEGGTGIPGRGMRRYPSYALMLVTAGEGLYEDPVRTERLTPGSLVLVFPGRPHWYGTTSGTWDETFLVVDGPLFALAEQRGVLDPGRPVVHGLPVDRWRRRLDAFRLTPRPSQAGGRDAEALELLALLAEAADPALERGAGSRGGGGAGWFARSVDLLESDLDRQLPMPEVAAQVGLPYETWRRRFRARAGEGPLQYRARHRLDAAAELLTHTSLSTRDIAAGLGFSDERHLIRRFRARSGVTPRQFRDGARSASVESTSPH